MLMILDHVLIQVAPGHTLRWTVTRLSLPLFLLVAGALWRPGLRWRHLQLTAAAAAATVLAPLLGMPTPNILVLVLGGVLLMHAATRAPWAWLAVCVVAAQTYTYLLPGWWAGYEPWTVLALLLVGHLGRVHLFGHLGATPRGLGLLELVGRYPLTIYVGHLLVLVEVSRFLGPRALLT